MRSFPVALRDEVKLWAQTQKEAKLPTNSEAKVVRMCIERYFGWDGATTDEKRREEEILEKKNPLAELPEADEEGLF
jgi:hypothetical protein